MSNPLSSFYSKIATANTRATLTAVLVFLLPFERIPSLNVNFYNSYVTIRLSQIVALALIIVSVGPIVNYYKSKPHLPKLFLPAFLLSYFISTLISSDIKRATMVFVFTVFVVLLGSAIAATFTKDQLPRLEKYLYFATGVVLLVGFYQYAGDVFGLSPAFTGLRDIYVKEVFGFPRIQSTALEPLYYGSFLLIPYCLLIAKQLSAKKTNTKQLVFLGAITTQIVLTVSRGALYSAILALVILVIVMALKHKTIFSRIMGISGLVAASCLLALGLTWAGSLAVNSKLDKYKASTKTQKLVEQASNTKSQGDRIRNRKLAINAFKENPLLGIGPGNFNQYAIEHYPKYAKVAPVIVNNEPLELLAEAGLAGALLFMAFIGWEYMLLTVEYAKNRIKGARLEYWALALLVYMITLAIQYQTFSTLYVMHVWVVIGLLMAFTKTPKRPTN